MEFINNEKILDTYHESIQVESLISSLNHWNSELELELKEFKNNKIIINESFSDIVKDIVSGIYQLFSSAINALIKVGKMLVKYLLSFINKYIKPIIMMKNTHKMQFTMGLCNSYTYRIKSYSAIDKAYADLMTANTAIKSTMQNYLQKNIKELKCHREHINRYLNSEQHITTEEVIYYMDTLFKSYDAESKSYINKDGNIQGKSIIDEVLRENISALKLEDLDKLRDSGEFIFSLYTKLKESTISQLIDFLANEDNPYNVIDEEFLKRGIVRNNMLTELKNILEYSLSEVGDVRYLDKLLDTDLWYNQHMTDGDKTKKVNIHLKCIVRQNKAILEALANAFRINFTDFYINYYYWIRSGIISNAIEKKFIGKNIKKVITSDIKKQNLEDFHKIFMINFDNFVFYNDELFDFTEMGLGKIVFSPDLVKASDKPITRFKNLFYSTRIYRYIKYFDITVICHGVNRDISFIKYLKELRSNSYEYSLFRELYSKEILTIEELTQKSIDNIDGSEYISFNSLKFGINSNISVRINGRYIRLDTPTVLSKILNKRIQINDIILHAWVTTKLYDEDLHVQTPDRICRFTNIECLVYQLLKEGYKSINIVVCNKAKCRLDNPKFIKHGFVIAISNNDVFS